MLGIDINVNVKKLHFPIYFDYERNNTCIHCGAQGTVYIVDKFGRKTREEVHPFDHLECSNCGQKYTIKWVDEGEGFKDLEKWNEFNRKRLECLHTSDFESLTNYVSFRTMKSDEQDGGNALFAALEYWNGGFVYNGKRNGVAMLKRFQQKRRGVTVEE